MLKKFFPSRARIALVCLGKKPLCGTRTHIRSSREGRKEIDLINDKARLASHHFHIPCCVAPRLRPCSLSGLVQVAVAIEFLNTPAERYGQGGSFQTLPRFLRETGIESRARYTSDTTMSVDSRFLRPMALRHKGSVKAEDESKPHRTLKHLRYQ